MQLKPSFALFQRVLVETIGDETIWRDEAVVTGVLFRCPEVKGSIWAYQVTYYGDISSSPWVEIPHSEIVAEHELKPIK